MEESKSILLQIDELLCNSYYSMNNQTYRKFEKELENISFASIHRDRFGISTWKGFSIVINQELKDGEIKFQSK